MCFVMSNWKYASTGSDSDSAPNSRQAIIWNNVGTLHWRIYASLGLNAKLDFNLYTSIFLHQNEYLCSLMIPCSQKIFQHIEKQGVNQQIENQMDSLLVRDCN